MRHATFLSAAVLGLALVSGCDKSDSTNTTAKPSTPSSAAPAPAVNPPAPLVPSDAAATTAPVADAKTAEAQKLLDQTMTYIKENKLDLADKSLSALEKMKAQLPASYAPKIDQARSMLDTAKKGDQLKSLVPSGAK
jgi:hypothetical protein